MKHLDRPIPWASKLDRPIPWASKAKYLGVTLDSKLTFGPHIKIVRDKAAFYMGRLHCLLTQRSKLSLSSKVTLWKTVIRPVISYACIVFAHAAPTHIRRLETLQNRFMRTATGAPWYMRNLDLNRDLRLPTITQYMKETCRKFALRAPSHPNQYVRHTVDLRPLTRLTTRRRRALSVLLDPDDPVTVAIAAAAASYRQQHTNNTMPHYTNNNAGLRSNHPIILTRVSQRRRRPTPTYTVATNIQHRSPVRVWYDPVTGRRTDVYNRFTSYIRYDANPTV